jgi:hypothetical protein
VSYLVVITTRADMDTAIGSVEAAHLDRCAGPCGCMETIGRLRQAVEDAEGVGAA